MSREYLLERRLNRTFEFDHLNPDGRVLNHYTATVGFYDDGRVGEVFIGSRKIGTDADVAMKDAAIALSLALQYGCPLQAFQGTFMRRNDGVAESAIGQVVDLIIAEFGLPVLAVDEGGEG